MIILYALMGLVVGAVVNVLADVFPYRHKKISGPVCPACDQPRSVIQSIGVVAYLAGKRRCASCGRPIAVRNVVVEVGLAVLFALLYERYSDFVILILASFFTAVLVLVTVTDLEHRLIPNRAMYPAILVAVLLSPVWFGPGWYLAFVGGAIGFVFFWLTVVVGTRLVGPGAMSWGDVTLAAFVGLITGVPGIVTALVVTILAGGVLSLVLLVTRVVNLRSGIPYGPFIAIGGFVAMVYGQQLMMQFLFRP